MNYLLKKNKEERKIIKILYIVNLINNFISRYRNQCFGRNHFSNPNSEILLNNNYIINIINKLVELYQSNLQYEKTKYNFENNYCYLVKHL